MIFIFIIKDVGIDIKYEGKRYGGRKDEYLGRKRNFEQSVY